MKYFLLSFAITIGYYLGKLVIRELDIGYQFIVEKTQQFMKRRKKIGFEVPNINPRK